MSEIEQPQPVLFRRRRFAAPHRRRHPLRRLARPFAGAVAVVGIPAAVVWWVVTSPQFEIASIEAVASARVPASWVVERLDGLRGRHLLAVRLSEIEGRLADHPWIADLVVRRQLPGRLEVSVMEKTPAALWSDPGDAEARLFVLDAAGERIAPLSGVAGAGEAVDLPLISARQPAAVSARQVAAAIRLASEWERLSPGDTVSQVEMLRSGDYRLVTSALPFTVVVRGDRLTAARDALTRALPLLGRGDTAAPAPTPSLVPPLLDRVASVDLRFSRQIVLQPAAAPPRQEEG